MAYLRTQPSPYTRMGMGGGSRAQTILAQGIAPAPRLGAADPTARRILDTLAQASTAGRDIYLTASGQSAIEDAVKAASGGKSEIPWAWIAGGVLLLVVGPSWLRALKKAA